MRKIISLLLGLSFIFSTFSVACNSGDNTKPVEPVFDGWNPSNILEKPVTDEDVLFGSWVAFADTKKQLSALDQLERYYFGGLNFIPYACTLPSKGILSDSEREFISRDMTSTAWWLKVDEAMKEYNMVYYFSTLAGLANDYEATVRRPSMDTDEALSDARTIVPHLNNCIGIHVVDEPVESAFDHYSLWAKRYANITGIDGEKLDLEVSINHLGYDSVDPYKNWLTKATSDVKIISHDVYPFFTEYTNYSILSAANAMRIAANEFNVKIRAFPQSCSYTSRRMPNLDEIKWNVNLYLAMGATSFVYFNYIMYPAEGCSDAIFALDGSVLHPEIYDGLTDFHKEVRALGENLSLTGLMAKDVYVNGGNSGGVAGLPNNWLIDKEGIDASDNLIFSHFVARPYETEDLGEYLCITNNSFTDKYQDKELYVGENSGITGLELYNNKTGKFEKVNLLNGAFSISLEKSEAKFFRLIKDSQV